MPKPNGLTVSNDGRTLYVSDSREKHWKAFNIAPDGNIGPGRVFFEQDMPIAIHPTGCQSTKRGISISQGGRCLGHHAERTIQGAHCRSGILFNVTFGGQDGKTLYLTCSEKFYSLAMCVRGGVVR